MQTAQGGGAASELLCLVGGQQGVAAGYLKASKAANTPAGSARLV